MTEKSLPQPSSPQPKGRMFSPYALIWAAGATASVLYLVLLATQPSTVAHYLGAGGNSAEADANQKAITETVAEVQTLRNTIDLFRNELIEIRAQVTNQTEIARNVESRIASLETPPVDPKQAAKDAAAKAAQDKLAKAKAKAEEKVAAAEAAKTAAKTATPTAKKAPEAALETGSVAQPAAGAISFGPPTVTTTIAVPPSNNPAPVAPPATNLVGVQIATGPSVDSLRLSWTLLNERHGENFRSLQPRYVTDTSGPEQTYDLVVGPVASVDEARRLCQELAMKATPCQVSRFTGDAL
ncbi:hypothetical protein [Hyphomicrobium sp.]|uniref:hypothetical protein n=1 Tax=Hyphomicrobium sp. TaxID=82 RepID=UPI002E36A5DB|nr:hypothetical protein [Hyphomicrobium sp.]HEX2842780.1 hypothetical protein [Hyphomicrobium sp.]